MTSRQRLSRAAAAARLAITLCVSSAGVCTSALAQAYQETDLVSDLPGRAALQDPNLVNPWGMSFAPGRPFWISDNGTGLSTLYTASGGIIAAPVVTIPAPPGSPLGTVASPTGQVYSGASGVTLPGGAASVFTFATENGTLSGWNPAIGNTALLAVDNSAKGLGSVYKGLALVSGPSQTLLYAADFRNGAVDVFDNHFKPVNLGSAAFTDPTLPSGYAPFNVAQQGTKLLVSYALQNGEKKDDVGGAGHGFVDEFNFDGTLSKRLISGGALNSPWGMTLAPSSFGVYGGDLLVGNFGNGMINAFDPGTGAFKGMLKDSHGNPIMINGLWGLTFRPDIAGANGKLFFTAGINDEANGLFGSVSAVPEPPTLLLVALGLVPVLRHRQKRAA